ncbi:hypothetical protein E4U21_003301 [Claviceps maximensis]|nr:hypothetical protein E4U21_003301 [Claviceps maximensis]
MSKAQNQEVEAINFLKLLRSAQCHENLLSLLYYHPTRNHGSAFLLEQPCPWPTDFLTRATDEYTPQKPVSFSNPEKPLPLSRWTAVSDDDAILTHVFKLFWTWDATPSRTVHRGMLIEAIYARERGDARLTDQLLSHFCSEALINAILAYAVDSFTSTEEGEAKFKGRDFAREAERLLNLQPRVNTIASLQTTAILSAFEHAFGDPHTRWITKSLIDVQSVRTIVPENILPTDAQLLAKVQEALSFIQSGLYQLNV